MIIPLVFERDFSEIQRIVSLVEDYSSLIQIDIADGKFVDGATFQEVERLDEIKTKSKFELHIMAENPLKYLEKKIKSVASICSHVEVLGFENFLKRARGLGYKVGAVINTETPLNKLEPFATQIDYVQFMSITPGGQGRPFKKEVLKRIALFKTKHPEIKTQVDGAMNEDTIPLVVRAGIDNIGIGSALVKADNIREKYKAFEKLIKGLT